MPDRVKELTGGGASYAIDTTAVSAVVKQAQLSLRNRGTLVALGLGAEEYAIDAIDLLQNGKVIRSSIEGESDPQTMIPRLLEMRADGPVRRRRPGHDLPLHPDQLRHQRRAGREVVKPVLVW